jgi:hypothetical protein
MQLTVAMDIESILPKGGPSYSSFVSNFKDGLATITGLPSSRFTVVSAVSASVRLTIDIAAQAGALVSPLDALLALKSADSVAGYAVIVAPEAVGGLSAIPQPTCADTNADLSINDPFNCDDITDETLINVDGFANMLSQTPGEIECTVKVGTGIDRYIVSAGCTEVMCCTREVPPLPPPPPPPAPPPGLQNTAAPVDPAAEDEGTNWVVIAIVFVMIACCWGGCGAIFVLWKMGKLEPVIEKAKAKKAAMAAAKEAKADEANTETDPNVMFDNPMEGLSESDEEGGDIEGGAAKVDE